MITVKYLNDEKRHVELKLYTSLKIEGDPREAAAAQHLGMYVAVLEINSDDLDYAFKVMQNTVVTDSWLLLPVEGTRPLVKPIIGVDGMEYGWRSACVGDIFNLNGTDHVCAAVGFVALPKQWKTYEITLQDTEETWHSWRQACRDYQEAAESGLASAKLRNMRLHNVTRIK